MKTDGTLVQLDRAMVSPYTSKTVQQRMSKCAKITAFSILYQRLIISARRFLVESIARF